MPDTKIKIKSRRKSNPNIKVRKRFLSVQDIKSLTRNVLKLNDFTPLQKTTIQDIFDKTNKYLKGTESKRNKLIKIKSVKLFKNAN